MSKIDDGGPAFPISLPGFGDNGAGGMSLRDYFASQALAGLYACRDLQLAVLGDFMKLDGDDFNECMAMQAYQQADAMLAARQPPTTDKEKD